MDHTLLSQQVDPLDSIAPAQEFFGPPFPEIPGTHYISPPSFDSRQPGQALSDIPQPQAIYTSPQFYTPPPDYPDSTPPPGYGYNLSPAYGYAIPPQEVYGRPLSILPVRPLPLGKAIRELPRQYWRVLTHPKAQTFVEEQGKAAWNIIWVQLLFLGVVQALAILAVLFLEFFFLQILVPGRDLAGISQQAPLVGTILVVICIAFTPVPFFIGAGIYHVVAKAFRGSGSFLSFCYSYALITIPIGILSLVLSLVPCVGSLAGLAGAVYEVILLIYMTMGVHRLSGGKATTAILIPVITGVIVVIGLYVAYFILIFSILPH